MASVSRKYLLILSLFCIPLFFINIHNGHSWGDDFAQYIKEAQNIASGQPYYRSNYIFNKYNNVYAPPQYPPGFPLLLAPVVKMWGLDFRPMFYFNSLLLACLLFALFAYFHRKKINPAVAVCLAVLITYNSYLLDMKGSVLADIPCMLFTTLYLAYRESDKFSWKRIAVLILFCVIAIQIRSQAIFILGAEALFLFALFVRTLVREKRVSLKPLLAAPSVYVIVGVVLLNLIFDKLLFPTPANTTVFYNGFIQQVMQGSLLVSAKDNFYYMLKTIATYFYYENGNGFLNGAIFFVQGAGLTFGALGFVMNITRRVSLDDFFFLIMCVVIIFYPVHDQRYFLPALPILFYYCYTALHAIIPVVSRMDSTRGFIMLTVIYLLLGMSYIRKISVKTPVGLIPQPKDTAAFNYIARHVNDTDAIVFAKPRALTLFTGKKTICVAWQVSYEMNKKIFDSNHVRYILVIHGYEDEFFNKYMRDIQHPVDSANIADGYTLYSLY